MQGWSANLNILKYYSWIFVGQMLLLCHTPTRIKAQISDNLCYICIMLKLHRYYTTILCIELVS